MSPQGYVVELRSGVAQNPFFYCHNIFCNALPPCTYMLLTDADQHQNTKLLRPQTHLSLNFL
jgi:hypothetical protein